MTEKLAMNIFTISETDFNDLFKTMEWMRDQTKDHPNSHGHGASIGKLEMLMELRELFLVENRETSVKLTNAAPELLSALQDWAEWHYKKFGDTGTDGPIAETAAAIEKATT